MQRVRPAVVRDTPFLLHLQRTFYDALGFLPRAALNEYVQRDSVRVGLENGCPAGYLLTRLRLGTDPQVCGIIQAAVAMDAQRRRLGLLLVEGVVARAASAGRDLVQAWCATDLQANEFWHAAGFECVGQRTGGRKRQRRLYLWRRALTAAGRARLSVVAQDLRGPGGVFLPAAPRVVLPTAAA